MQAVDEFDLKVQLLIHGFDETGAISFAEVSNPGVATDRSILDAWAIGSGFHMAMASLNRRAAYELSPEAVVYRCCEAKFAAEFAPDVGRSTTVIIGYPDGSHSFLAIGEIEKIRKIWEASRHQPVPEEAVKEIHVGLKSNFQPAAGSALDASSSSSAPPP